MPNMTHTARIAVAAAAALLAIALTACRPKPPEAPPAPVPPPPEVSASSAPSAAAPGQGTDDANDNAEAPAAGHVAASPAPAARTEPDLAAMKTAVARPDSKMGVPVDLRYQFDGEVEVGRPVTLHLAAVPQVNGSNLSVGLKEDAGLQATVAPINVQKASASTAYRQQLSLTRLAGGPAELRVLVTMEVDGGSTFAFFSVPLTASEPSPRKGTRLQQ
jgi:hypothetical protein